jgi:hypothetical protein
MKLTNKDKNYLISIGYTNDDFSEIEFTSNIMNYDLILIFKEKQKLHPQIRLTQKQAIGLLGRDKFLSGLSRATFHGSAVRSNEGLPNMEIYFNIRKN